MKRLLAGLTPLVALLLVACSDDSNPPAGDGPVTTDQAVVDMQVPTEGGTPDQTAADGPLADQGVTPDQGGGGDAAQAKTLTSSHSGWKKTKCSDCHALPVTGHTTSNIADCASCHGGNGACDPPGSHSNTMTCTSSGCHGSKHGVSDKAACVSCHFASAGTVACP